MIAEKLNGSLEASSKVGFGSTFTFSFAAEWKIKTENYTNLSPLDVLKSRSKKFRKEAK
jgi:hypothetical protein